MEDISTVAIATDDISSLSNPKGKSFCIPRTAIKALIEAKADVHTISAYLTLACFTDQTGCFSSASNSAVRRYTQSDRKRCEKSIEQLLQIRVKNKPLVLKRESWQEKNIGLYLPDGPTERSKILHVLSDFNEPLQERVWFGSGLVEGFRAFRNPLQSLKNCGSIAARMLLLCYQHFEMTTYGATNPHLIPWHSYVIARDDVPSGDWRIRYIKSGGTVANQQFMADASGENNFTWAKHDKACWQAFNCLIESGFLYEIMVVLNRDPIKRTFSSGGEYGDIADDAEPLYVLDCLTKHGEKPRGENGLAWATAKTAGELGVSVAGPGGIFNGLYAYVVPGNARSMVAGLYRPRFRVSNPENLDVKDAWGRIFRLNRQGLTWINSLRARHKLSELKMPT